MSIAERLAMSPELRDTSTWPAPTSVPEPKADLYKRRKAAIEAYLNWTSFETIAKDYSIPKSEVYRLLGRCLKVQPDRNIAGFFGIVPGRQLVAYQRRGRAKATSISGKAGFAGAFLQLMGEHDDLRRYIESQVGKGGSKTAAQIAREIQVAFLQRCEKHRAPNEYPFIVGDHGRRALRKYIENLQSMMIVAAGNAGETILSRDDDAPLTGQPSGAALLRPYEEVELDGHNGDFYFVLKLPGPNGQWVYSLPLRIWLILMIDRSSRAILGYSYRVGGTNYSSRDVLRCIANALTVWTPKEITLPGLAYRAGAGFPSSCTPLGQGRLFDALHVDNAWANTAHVIQAALSQILGVTLNVGRAGEPTARPFVERLNQTLENRGFRRIPVGFRAISKEDRERAYRAAAEYPITLEELEQLIDVMVADYNSEVHAQHTNRTPLEFLRQWDASTDSPIRVADDVKALLDRVSKFEGTSTVKGGNGRRPFFRFKGAEYTCDALKQLGSSVGCRVRVVASIYGDSRYVRAYLQVGDREVNIGLAKAMPPWHLTPLTFDQRQVVENERKKGRLPVVSGTDAGGAFLHLRKRKAAERKGNANRLARFGAIPDTNDTKRAARPADARSRVRAKDWIKLDE